MKWRKTKKKLSRLNQKRVKMPKRLNQRKMKMMIVSLILLKEKRLKK
jgi:hypothetical protein